MIVPDTKLYKGDNPIFESERHRDSNHRRLCNSYYHTAYIVVICARIVWTVDTFIYLWRKWNPSQCNLGQVDTMDLE